MYSKKRKYRFKLKPGSFVLLVPVIILIIIMSNQGSGHTPDPKESELEETNQGKVAIVTSSSRTAVTVAETEPVICPVERYADVAMTDDEYLELAEIIYHEARGESLEGQQAVAEVVFNRVIADNFPASVHEVIHEGEGKKTVQFSTVYLLGTAVPQPEQYKAIERALYGPTIIPEDVVYFSRKGENERVWGSIGNHVFCYQYSWD